MSSTIDWKARAEAAESKLAEIHRLVQNIPGTRPKIRPERPLGIYDLKLNADLMIGYLHPAIIDGPITVEVWNKAVKAATK